MNCFFDRLKRSEYIYSYPSLTLQGFIDIVSTQGRQIYMCEHEKSTLLQLVQLQAYHTRLITVTPSEKKKSQKNHTEDKPGLGDFLLTWTESTGSQRETEQVG